MCQDCSPRGSKHLQQPPTSSAGSGVPQPAAVLHRTCPGLVLNQFWESALGFWETQSPGERDSLSARPPIHHQHRMLNDAPPGSTSFARPTDTH